MRQWGRQNDGAQGRLILRQPVGQLSADYFARVLERIEAALKRE